MTSRWQKHRTTNKRQSFGAKATNTKGEFVAHATKNVARYTSKQVITTLHKASAEDEQENNLSLHENTRHALKRTKAKLEKAKATKTQGNKNATPATSVAEPQEKTYTERLLADDKKQSRIVSTEAKKLSFKPSFASSPKNKALKAARNTARRSGAKAAAARAVAINSLAKKKVAQAIAAKMTALSTLPLLVPIALTLLIALILIVGFVGYNTSIATNLSETESRVAMYLRDKGLDDIHIAAIMGNIEAESGFDSSAEELGGGGRGLCQWTGGRFTELQNFAASQGVEWQNLDLQLDFLWAEMTGEGQAADYTSIQYNHEGFLALDNLEDCVMYFGRNFERPNEQYAHWDRRISSAEGFYAALQGNISLDTDGIVGSALSKLGSPYVWGAAGPNEFDCSGLVVWSYAQNGINGVHRTTYAQINQCVIIPKEEAQAGDLVFMIFSSPGVPEHVGIYLGDGRMVHAPTFGSYVKIDPAGWMYADAVYARYIGN